MANNFRHYSWSIANKIGGQIIGFVGNIVIARQLTPDDYGLIGMLAIFIAISWSFTESGLADYLLSNPNIDSLDVSTVFIFNIIVGLILYFLLNLSAPLIANFYERHELVNIIRVLGLSIILRAISFTPLIVLQKELRFKELAMLNLSASTLSIIISYIMALQGFGYWSLVFQNISIPLTILFILLLFLKWRPKFRFNKERFRPMINFGTNLLVAFLINQVGKNMHATLIGKFQTPRTLGYYLQASKINETVFQGINSVVLGTSYSIIAREPDGLKRRDMYKDILNHFVFIHLFICFFIAGCAQQIMGLIFGSQWEPSAPYLRLLTISTFLLPFTTVNYNMIKIAGRVELYRNLTFLGVGFNLVALLFTYKYSIEVIILGQIIARYLSSLFDIVFCGKHGLVYPLEQIKIFFVQGAVPLGASLISYWLASTSMFNDEKIQFVVFTVLYILSFFIINIMVRNRVILFYLNWLRTSFYKSWR